MFSFSIPRPPASSPFVRSGASRGFASRATLLLGVVSLVVAGFVAPACADTQAPATAPDPAAEAREASDSPAASPDTAAPTAAAEARPSSSDGKESTGMIQLPPPVRDGKVSVEKAIQERRSIRRFTDEALTLAELGQLLWSAQGITEPNRELRAAPSAGATYPLELSVLVGDVKTLAPGLYRYHPSKHALEKTLDGDGRDGLSGAALGQAMIRQAPASLVVSAIAQRTASRYGQRAERYVHMEAGHVGQNVHLQCIGLGLGTVMVGAFDDAAVKRVLSLPRAEEPLYIMPVGRPR